MLEIEIISDILNYKNVFGMKNEFDVCFLFVYEFIF